MGEFVGRTKTRRPQCDPGKPKQHLFAGLFPRGKYLLSVCGKEGKHPGSSELLINGVKNVAKEEKQQYISPWTRL